MAVFGLRKSDALLRVMIFKPGKRMVLALGLEHGLVLLDLSVQGDDQQCRLQFRLETPLSSQGMRERRQWLWLRTLGACASVGLERHLHRSERVFRPEISLQPLP